MRTKSITVERNFHIMNEDRFIMEKISQTIELDENDLGFEQAAMDAARQSIVDNFKHAYPGVNPELNFDKPKFIPQPVQSLAVVQKDTSSRTLTTKEIENEINNSKTVKELQTWQYYAPSNNNLQTVYNKRLEELSK